MEHPYKDLTTWLAAKEEYTREHGDIAYLATDEDAAALLRDVEAAPSGTCAIFGLRAEKRFVGLMTGIPVYRGTQVSRFGVWGR